MKKQQIVNIAFILLFSIYGCKKPLQREGKDVSITPCQSVHFIHEDTTTRRLMKETISSFVMNGLFRNDKGIVELRIFHDSVGNERWYITAIIEDRYKYTSDVTPVFEEFRGDVILIYDDELKEERENLSDSEKKQIRECQSIIISDRLYAKVERQFRWSTDRMGDRKIQGARREATGWPATRIYIFYKDGRYELESQTY
ncbi:hypothetical protein [Flammeovirga sp. OC4]|uniref:hypothetical protein n=1 Tax=Flammeovirga sp. OC4 TaxID=1382345 RepID=UPI0005C4F3B7|nr:hypothetical protein [Flammeovirga sp. OC4]